MNEYKIGKIIVSAPDEWLDITDMDDPEMPFTLAKDDGVGALQFSLAKYKKGELPEIELKDLEEIRVSFAQRRGLEPIGNPMGFDGPLKTSAQSYRMERDYLRVWYCSNGRDVALISYISDWGNEGNEPVECEVIVRSIKFDD